MLSLLILFLSILSVNSLSPFLTYYEPLNYRTPDLARISRSLQSDQKVKLEIDAFNRTFKLNLRKISRQESVFVEDAYVVVGNETRKIEDVNFYTGFVEGDGGSRVAGTIDDGVFTGTIEMGNGKEYGIEYAIRHNATAPFHSFIYDVEHIKMPVPKKITKRSDGSFSSSESTCGLSDPKIAESIKVTNSTESSRGPRNPFRSKREAKKDEASGIWDYRQCTIKFQVDHLLYKHIFDTIGKKDKTKTDQAIRNQIQKEVDQVNGVYKDTTFDGITGPVQFAVHSVEIFETADHPKNVYKDENLDVNSFLGKNAMQNLEDYCLGYAMTYRDFAGGTLGLAYVGAVCSTHKPTSETQRSNNAGIVTYLNHGAAVLTSVSYLTLAHEIGHNFGSPHDESAECSGGGNGNEFIMWYSATSGDKENNKKFSTCSIKTMSEKLQVVMKLEPRADVHQAGKRNCFVATGQPICGNGITEKTNEQGVVGGEECDCGTLEECTAKENSCCHPPGAKDASGNKVECTLQAGKQCSMSQGPCCTKDCKFQPSTVSCLAESDCAEEAFCKADSAVCPDPPPRNNGEPCKDVTGVCKDGKCNTAAFCEVAGLKECSSDQQSCMRYCEKDGVCQSTVKLSEFEAAKYSQNGRKGHPGVMLGPRSLCMGGKGTCNQFDMCKKVQATGSISRNMGEIVKGFKSFGDLMIRRIWILILVVIGGIVVLVVVIKFCSYATPSSNPNKPKAKSVKEIKNMMSNRAKRLSQRVTRKKKEAAPTTPVTAQTPGDKTKTKETNEDEE